MLDVSASQISKFRLCPRRWWFAKVGGLDDPSSPAAARGQRLHGLLERYLKGQELKADPGDTAIIVPGLKYLPPPETVETERWIEFTDGGARYRGYIDAIYRHSGGVLLIDHKTTSSLNNALTPPELAKDVQAQVYAKWAMRALGVDMVSLRWVYYCTTKPGACATNATITAESLDTTWPIVQKSVAQMADTAKAETHEDVPMSIEGSGCYRYGPCPYLDICYTKGANSMASMKEKLLAKKAAREKAQAVEAAAVNPPAEDVATPEVLPPAEAPPPAELPGGVKINRKATPAPAATADDDAPGLYTLYLGCAPVDTRDLDVVSYARIAYAANQSVRHDHGCHYRAVEYGKGPGYFTEAVEAQLQSIEPGTHLIVDDPALAEARDVMPVLTRYALQTIRGY